MSYFTYINICLMMFDAMGVNPRKGHTLSQIIVYLITIGSQGSFIYLGIYLIIYKENLTVPEINSSLETIFLLSHGFMKCNILLTKQNKVRNLIERIDRFWKIEDVEDEEQKKEHLEYMNYIRNMFRLYTFMCLCTTLSFMCRGLFIKGEYFTFATYVPQWAPFGVVLVYEWLVFLTGVYCPIAGMDKFIMTILLLTKLQFKMLNQEVERAFNDIGKSEAKTEDNRKKIKKIVDHHDFLLDYVDRINNVFSEGMLIYIVIIVLSMCIQMYIVSTERSVKSLIKASVYMTNGLAQYFLCYCLPAQALSDEADQTRECAYFSKWYDNPSSSKVAQVLIIGRGQKKIQIFAGGIIKIDLETCLKTIKTMVSYAMFLRTIGIGEE